MAERVLPRRARRLRVPDRRRQYRRLRAHARWKERGAAALPVAERRKAAAPWRRAVPSMPALLAPVMAAAILALPAPLGVERLDLAALEPAAIVDAQGSLGPPADSPIAAVPWPRTKPVPPPVRAGRGAAARELARADQGDPAAQFAVAVRYATGNGFARDHARAAAWFREAAINGLAAAQFDLAVLYEKGLGLAHDPIEAVIWFQSAADQGDAAAQLRLGEIYAEGRGVRADPAAAFRWLRRAAEQGVAEAQRRLADAYERGEGVAASPRKAYAWYRMAAGGGDATAIAALARLQRDMPAIAVADGDEAAAALAARLGARDPDPPRIGRSGLVLALPDNPPARPLSPRGIGEIQRRLDAAGYDPGPPDGLVGERTAEAIRAYQKAKGLPVDGIPDLLLLNQLRAAAAGPPPAARR